MRQPRLRLATPEDNAALLDLFGAVPMSGNLVLASRREPDFFTLYDLQRGHRECYVYEENGEVLAMGTFLVRDGWLDGRPATLGYLGDLRTRFAGRRALALSRFYGQLFEDVRQRHGCDAFLTAVLASNRAAINALVRRKETRASQPRYQLLRRFTTASVRFTGLRRIPKSRFEVRHATPADVPAMARRLDEDHRQRPFGYRFDQGELEHRFARWPGLSLERTYLAYDKSGNLAACASAWDPSALKRWRVMDYRGPMRWVKRSSRLLTALLGYPPLPEPGGELRYFYLCNTSVAGDDPAALEAILHQVYADHRAAGYHFFSLCMYEGDPLRPALRRFSMLNLDFHLYAVTSSAAPRESWPEGRTGFEISLA